MGKRFEIFVDSWGGFWTAINPQIERVEVDLGDDNEYSVSLDQAFLEGLVSDGDYEAFGPTGLAQEGEVWIRGLGPVESIAEAESLGVLILLQLEEGEDGYLWVTNSGDITFPEDETEFLLGDFLAAWKAVEEDPETPANWLEAAYTCSHLKYYEWDWVDEIFGLGFKTELYQTVRWMFWDLADMRDPRIGMRMRALWPAFRWLKECLMI